MAPCRILTHLSPRPLCALERNPDRVRALISGGAALPVSPRSCPTHMSTRQLRRAIMSVRPFKQNCRELHALIAWLQPPEGSSGTPQCPLLTCIRGHAPPCFAFCSAIAYWEIVKWMVCLRSFSIGRTAFCNAPTVRCCASYFECEGGRRAVVAPLETLSWQDCLELVRMTARKKWLRRTRPWRSATHTQPLRCDGAAPVGISASPSLMHARNY